MNVLRRCVLHIGMHKTGSSSIQDSLYQNLDNDKFLYARPTNFPNHSGLMCRAFIPNFQSYIDLASGDTTSDQVRVSMRNLIRGELKRCNAETIIFSAEELTNDALDIQALRDLLLEFVSEIKVVGYVRPPNSLLESGFQEVLKTELISLDSLWPYYRIRLEKFDQIFGSNNVEFWKFDTRAFRNGCVVTDFCDRMGIPLNGNWIKRSNAGLSKSAISLLYIYRTKISSRAISSKMVNGEMQLVARLADMKGSRLHFSQEMVAQCINNHIDDLKWVEQRLLCSLNDSECDAVDAINDIDELLQIDEPMRLWLGSHIGATVPESVEIDQFAKMVELLVSKWGN